MNSVLLILYYLLPPAAASYAALWGAKKFGDWKVGMISGSLIGLVVTIVVASLFWSDTDLCEQCNNGVSG